MDKRNSVLGSIELDLQDKQLDDRIEKYLSSLSMSELHDLAKFGLISSMRYYFKAFDALKRSLAMITKDERN